MIGLAIDPTTNDLFVRAEGDLAIVTGAEAIGQHVRQRLKTYRGEWFLDTTVGVPWLQELFGNAYDPGLAESVVKAEILDTFGVSRIDAFAVGFNRTTRALIIDGVEVLTVYDEAVRV